VRWLGGVSAIDPISDLICARTRNDEHGLPVT
jgi:hypothetical protein